MDLSNSKILVTGGAGFLGSAVVHTLRARGCSHIYVPRSAVDDLREKQSIIRVFEKAVPDVVIHLAAVVGGIEANRREPGRFFYENAIMGLQLMEQARRFGVKKFVTVGTVCAYPKFTPVPFEETSLWDGYPEETNAPYGLAKKMLLVQAQAYRAQYGFNSIYLLPANLYGPGDHCDLQLSHVIPALIRKCVEATEQGSPYITLWGDGSPTREFLFVKDAAEAIVLATQHYDGADPVNIGTGTEISIGDLAKIIAQAVNFRGEILWDHGKPNGQPRRLLDTHKARTLFGFQAKTAFDRGLKETIDWYLHLRPKLRAAS